MLRHIDQGRGIMNFGEAISSVFKHYVNSAGRAPRSEYWYWTLFLLMAGIVATVIDAVAAPGSGGNGPVSLVVSIGLLLPNITVGIRRLHDIDRTGWWFLIAFTIIGIVLLLVWACTRGTDGPNPFGPDPLARR